MQVGRETDLLQEPLGTEQGRQVGAHDLESHEPVVLEIVDQIDRSHPATAELALEEKALVKSFSQRQDQSHHCAGNEVPSAPGGRGPCSIIIEEPRRKR